MRSQRQFYSPSMVTGRFALRAVGGKTAIYRAHMQARVGLLMLLRCSLKKQLTPIDAQL
ncbi:hypothetical protein NT6N_33410 [Oceaniferula spumae]|uniref:Uncharacterized protein n=1 Tax=Oceaniferula spumae TaxID=2979115 RepID=A0AAT9FQM6_9BACT